jgi:hypothetical protein
MPVSQVVATNRGNITYLITLLLSLTTIIMLSNKGILLLLIKDYILKGL